MKKSDKPAAAPETAPADPRAGAQRITYFISGSDDAPPPQPATPPADDAENQE
jgi:hypothetical protein